MEDDNVIFAAVEEPQVIEQELTENPVPSWPGWTKIQAKGANTRRYRSPGGIEISNARFSILAIKYKSQKFIPESDILPPQKQSSPSFFQSKTSKSPPISTTTASKTSPDNKREEPLDLPEARPRVGSKPQGGRASARELSDSFQTTLLIATSLVALLLKFPDLAMNEMEAKGMSIPLANILEKSRLNERFGRMIANSGDYQLLGYALYLYLDRVTTAVNIRRQNATQPTSRPPYPEAASGTISGDSGGGDTLQPSAGNGYVSGGANLPYARTGTGRVTPITRQG